MNDDGSGSGGYWGPPYDHIVALRMEDQSSECLLAYLAFDQLGQGVLPRVLGSYL